MPERQFQVETTFGALDATELTPDNAKAKLVFCHGAGAGHRHATMQSLAEHFAEQGLASLRFNFPYMQAGKRRVDNQSTATQVIAEVFEQTNDGDVPLFLAGHSFGGRMASHAVAEGLLDCPGLIFCSFPLHQPKKPDIKRAAHLSDIQVPMLFLSGTRDDLADQELLDGVVANLTSAHLHWLDTANHSYVPLKRTRVHPLTVFEEMSQEVSRFVDSHL